MPLLQATQLSKKFRLPHSLWHRARYHQAVDRVSLRLEAGEVLGILGESGCGKSTLARLLSGVLTADSGDLLFRGKPLDQLSRLQKAQAVQLVFQDPAAALHPRLTIGEALCEPLLRVLGLGRADASTEVRQLLMHLALPEDILSRYPHEISGGQQQRACLARALTLKPALLICDEPLTALDRMTQAQVLQVLAKLRQSFACALIFISHDITMLRLIADKLVVMKDGIWLETGSTQTVLEQAQHPYTRYLLESVPKLYRSVRLSADALVQPMPSLGQTQPLVAGDWQHCWRSDQATATE